jgi:hypothetical protein
MLRGFKNNLNTYKDLIWLQAFQLSVLAPLRALRETKKLRAFAAFVSSCQKMLQAIQLRGVLFIYLIFLSQPFDLLFYLPP